MHSNTRRTQTIALDFTRQWEGRGGVWRYGISLARALAKLLPDGAVRIPCFDRLPPDRVEELRATGAAVAADNLHVCLDRLESLATRRGRYLPWDRFLPPLLSSGVRQWLVRSGIGRVDVCHSLFSARQAGRGMCRVATIHDLIPVLFPSDSVVAPDRFRKILEVHLHGSDAIIVPSHATKRDLVELFPAHVERIHVVQHGIDGELFTPEGPNDDQVLSRYGLQAGQYVRHAGSLERRKNLVALLDAYMVARRQHGLQAPLVFSGGTSQRMEDFSKRLQDPAVAPFVKCLGYTPDADLAALYRGSRALVLVSLYEGFGFPPLEAMSCGTPVIASDNSSLTEVVASAGLLVNPCDTSQVACALARVAEDAGLRGELREKGIRHARQFTWDAAARSTLEVYDTALEHFARLRAGGIGRLRPASTANSY
jgi:glycosyltransferase involved in cell wall biosynthesis